MADFKISRFRYTWKGQWVTATTYVKDDVVKYGGGSYVCLRGHTASADFYTDVDYTVPGSSPAVASPAWVTMTEGSAWRSDWVAATQYNVGDVAQYGGYTYLCVDGHLSGGTFAANSSKWIDYVASASWKGTFNPDVVTRYGKGDIVRYGATVYECIVEHSSSTRLESNQANWAVYYQNIDTFNTWTALTNYKINDLVKYGGSIWKCVTAHTGELAFTPTNWQVELYGYQFGGDWAPFPLYQIGDIVRYGGDLYYSNINNNDLNPRDREDSSIAWIKLAKGYNIRGEWTHTEYYKPGDVVRRGGDLYVALKDSDNDLSSLDYLSDSDWEKLVPGFNWRGRWVDGTSYAIGDLVIHVGVSYRCAAPHYSDSINFPGDNGSVFGLWEIYVNSGDVIGLQSPGDLVTYGLSRTNVGDGSSFGPTRIAIGQEDQILKVDNSNIATYYEKFGTLATGRYVAPNGVDRPDYGSSAFTPYKTIRYACEQVESIGLPIVINVLAGEYEEILPIIVPAYVAVKGDEVRGVTVKANSPILALANDSDYTIAVLEHLQTLTDNIVKATPLPVVYPGNNEIQRFSEAGTTANVTQINQLYDNIIDYINFYIAGTGLDPVLVGTNTATETTAAAAASLQANKNFLAAEAVAFMQSTYSAYNFDPASCRRDVARYIDAICYDLRYTGNYKTLLAARYYRNAVLGSAGEDMFYVRDATGIRNMTVSGLVGTLNPFGVFDFYQRPTGGAYVSLDPGWGPNDNRTWITTRSPYIQNVATFGYAAYGQVIDGALHNGGNKSIVSNDFTQIISDGIGAYVLNGGRAELVSVFTYYSQVGYLAENGGIIRATNGNNSYGKYGAMALGVNDLETPVNVRVNNHNNQASVEAAFAGLLGGDADRIIAVEFENCGQNYTTANYSITGAGTGVSVIQEEFRDQAVFEALLNNPYDSTGPGGTGFTFRTANAQTGTTTTIRLAGTDAGTEAEYLGLRIIIISGAGTGQYGYISAYNPSTKYVSVRKESDGTPGWDHLIPGYPINDVLLQSTRYQIEPRVTFSAPDFNTYTITMTNSSTRGAVIWGETYATFNDITGAAGTGVVDEEVTPVAAIWDVVKNGRSYTVTISSAGAGYAVGQAITIDGSDVGGIDEDNDITIFVTAISDDSTNSITGFRYSGQAASGNFVSFTTSSDVFTYSADGITWTPSVMPSSGNWTVAASGGNRFIAIKTGSNGAAVSINGIDWTAVTLPLSRNWIGAAYGGGTFVAISNNLDSAVYSTNGGASWSASAMPSFGDSSFNTWVDVCYGQNKFFAIANTLNTGAFSSDGITWTGALVDATDDSSQVDWVSCAYGNGRFIVLSSQGNLGYSFDGNTWYAGTSLPKQDGSTVMNWKKIRFAQGVFVAICDTGNAVIGGDATTGPTVYAAKTEDGVLWEGLTLSTALSWSDLTFGNPNVTLGDSTILNNLGTWVAVGSALGTTATRFYTGAKAKGRAILASGRIVNIRLWDPGSGYTIEPTMTVTDPNNTSEAFGWCRLGSGVLGQPTFLNRGIGYRSSTTVVNLNGDGFADIIPNGRNITLSGFSEVPGPGAQLIFNGKPTRYRLVKIITELGDLGDGSQSIFIQISPPLEIDDLIEHDTQVAVRVSYSSCRITGHDFLDIGTGNFVATNYPELYSQATFQSSPENEVVEGNGGRVFYTSTDQNGNFRTGELFAVEQATGIVTISADFFDLQGLSELKLGGVRLGGSAVVIREFSTDPLFSEDSNNIVPTQRAIKTYLASRLSVAGSDLIANAFTAGEVSVGGNSVTNVLVNDITIPVKADFSGANAGTTGMMLAMAMFYRSFKDDEGR